MPFQQGRKKTGGKTKGTINGQTLRRLANASDHITATVDRVLQEYSHIAFLDIGEAFDGAGNLLPIHDMPEGVRRAIAGIEVADLNIDRDGQGSVGKLHKIKLLDKGKALQDLAKHLGMFVERLEHKVEITASIAETLRARRQERLAAGHTAPPTPSPLGNED